MTSDITESRGLGSTDSNGDSNSGDKRQATAIGDSAGHSHDTWQFGIYPV